MLTFSAIFFISIVNKNMQISCLATQGSWNRHNDTIDWSQPRLTMLKSLVKDYLYNKSENVVLLGNKKVTYSYGSVS